MDVYKKYFYSLGKLTFCSMIVCSFASMGVSLFAAVWLGIWAEASSGNNSQSVFFYISIYVALSVASVVFSYLANNLGFAGAINASSSMHAEFVHSLMRAPISFFDSTPIGRITNRLSKDMGQVDTLIMFNFQLFLRYRLHRNCFSRS